MVMCLYTISHELLSCINVPSYLLNGDGADMFNKCDILNTVNQIYTDIVCAFLRLLVLLYLGRSTILQVLVG